jgi:HTH-like domain
VAILPGCGSQAESGVGERMVRIYQQNRQVDGSPRSQAALRAAGQRCGNKRVARLMRERGLSAKPRTHPTRTTDSQHAQPLAPHLLNRAVTARAPNPKWVADLTAIWTAQDWLFLAGVLDRFSRMVGVGPWMHTAMRRWASRPRAWRWHVGCRSQACSSIRIGAGSLRQPTTARGFRTLALS